MKTLAPFLITGNITLSQEPLANLGWTSAAQRPSSMTWYIKRKIQISQTENNYREGKLFGGWGGVLKSICAFCFISFSSTDAVSPTTPIYFPQEHYYPRLLSFLPPPILYLPVCCTCSRNICFSVVLFTTSQAVLFHLRCSRSRETY